VSNIYRNRTWVEENIAQKLAFHRLPLGHQRHLKSTNMLERLNEEIKWRTRDVRIGPPTDFPWLASSQAVGRPAVVAPVSATIHPVIFLVRRAIGPSAAFFYHG